ncbi:gephyrin-like molybdotransferase Glp [Kineosporia sp. NBRC 101731]|uniref:molybdotransferase-like divisome protein Glp n=1 Tax=Kineosporia sp. NBRC 101731 TaxID=3032199 RepID=UPI0024A17064|nr:gephyrin-like molybdotransferase Glp [Kineosporia sp. NBRC 101731]GLY31375.1 molybdopterin molybdenumtransferase MoeA [Kineosporia sp. NBRC 101731]
MRSVDEHLKLCLKNLGPLPAVEVPLSEAAGCVLAQDVVSGIDMPRFDNSSMDGYAVRAAEVASATAGSPVNLPVLGDIPAGRGDALELAPGTTLRIMTGAPVPAGADSVVQVEWTDGGVSQVRIDRPVPPGKNIRRSGEDVREGETVLTAGTWLTARHITLAASVGIDRLTVHPRPRVVVLPSGSELVPPGKPLQPGQIHDSNGYGLIAAAQAAGTHARHGGIMPDTPEAVGSMLEAAAADADLLITTGGVSAGAYDTVKAVLRELGTMEFVQVAMQPGKPQGFGTIGPRNTPLFTLPGNPVSALLSFEVFVAPALRRLAGRPDLDRSTPTATVVEGWRSPPARRQFARCLLTVTAAGPTVRPVGGQGSHLVADLAGANCLVIVPEDVTQVSEGDELPYIVLESGP